MFTADHALAEDLSAETFEKAFRSWRRYDPRRASERTWLCRIARNVALDHFRSESRRRRREERYALETGREGDMPDLGFGPELEAALRTLSAGERRSWRSGSCSTSTPTPLPACSASAGRRAP